MQASLIAEHLADLQRSGLSNETIERACIRSVAPRELQKLGTKYHTVTSAYELPYLHLDGTRNEFRRLRLFPPFQDDHGHTCKYFQLPGTDAKLYFPPLCDWRTIAANPKEDLLITEGEKKALCAAERGLPSVAIGGLWSWIAKLEDGGRLVLQDFELIAWNGRKVELVPDSDAWAREDLLCAVYALGVELTRRGASVQAVQLPALKGHSKTGLDDWLLTADPWPRESFEHLERFPLDHKAFKKAASWFQRREKRQAEVEAQTSEPEVQVDDDAVRIGWLDYGVSLTFSKLANGRAEVQAFRHAVEKKVPLTTPSNLNLTAPRSRTDLATRLAKLTHNIPWGSLVEAACLRALEESRKGEPAVIVTRDLEVAPPIVRIEGLVYDDMASFLYADGGSGKGYTAVGLALQSDSGTFLPPFNGQPGRCLYLDWESSLGDFVTRCNRYRRGHPCLADAQVVYRRCAVPLADDLREIKQLVREHAIKLLVLDSALGACGGELEKPETAERLFRALRALCVGTLVIAHPPKNAESPSIFGTTFFRNYARICWYLRKVQEVESDMLHLALEQTKNNLGRLHAPIGLSLSFGDGSVRLDPYDLTQDVELGETLPLSERIKGLLRDHVPRTVKVIADDLDVKRDSVAAVLRRYRGRHWIKGDGDDREAEWMCM